LEFIFNNGSSQEMRSLVMLAPWRPIELGVFSELTAFSVFSAIDAFKAELRA